MTDEVFKLSMFQAAIRAVGQVVVQCQKLWVGKAVMLGTWWKKGKQGGCTQFIICHLDPLTLLYFSARRPPASLPRSALCQRSPLTPRPRCDTVLGFRPGFRLVRVCD